MEKWQVLDVAELRRNRMRREGGRKIQWPVSLKTRMLFRDLLGELVELESEPMSEDTERHMEALREQIRGLPGFPQSYDPEKDVIVPVTTSMQR